LTLGFRPSLDDIDRLSRGKAAKRRGTGSRGVPHRLDEQEHKALERAKQQGYLVTKGRQRRHDRVGVGGVGNPLLNIYRLYCDAKNTPVVYIEKGSRLIRLDTVVVDFSPLRLPSDGPLRRICREIAQEESLRNSLETGCTAQAAAIEEPEGVPVEGLILDDAESAWSLETAPIWSLPEADIPILTPF